MDIDIDMEQGGCYLLFVNDCCWKVGKWSCIKGSPHLPIAPFFFKHRSNRGKIHIQELIW